MELGDLDAARARSEESLEASRKIGDPLEQAGAHIILGRLVMALGEYGEAEAHLLQALRLARSLP
ncbi:MAG: tetratricopeptide repeat protein, partial [Akkermansiaceae bacterium]|nr:tetratricopeptide repeat protein [Akkermansiaceae bacterium]